MGLTAALVVLLTIASELTGPEIGGVLAALPVLASVLAVYTHRAYGSGAVVALLRGMVSGMAAFVGFCAIVALLVVPAGTAVAFLVGAVSAVAVQLLALDGGIRLRLARAGRSRATRARSAEMSA
jgi:hypothetical protein